MPLKHRLPHANQPCAVLCRLWVYPFLCLLAVGMRGADWPQFRGLHRDGVSSELITNTWPKDGPAVIWKATIGQGYSGPVVGDGRMLLHHRPGDEDVVEAWDASTGKSLWRHSRPATFTDDFGSDDGPRATPAIDGNRVFTFSADGRLTALSLVDGHVLWEVDTAKDLKADKGFFGFACSPLVLGGVVIVQIGGANGAGIVGFDRESGRVRWKATDHEAGYAAPVAAELKGYSRVVCFDRAGLVVLDPAQGRVVTEFPWRARMHASVNAASPVVLGDQILLTASYGTGAILLKLSDAKTAPVWSGDEMLSAHFATPLLRQGFLYGFHGRQEQSPSLRCVEWATGRVRWDAARLGAGNILAADDKLLILLETGELILAAADPKEFRILARAQVLGSNARAIPAFANGRWYGRDKSKLVCLGL